MHLDINEVIATENSELSKCKYQVVRATLVSYLVDADHRSELPQIIAETHWSRWALDPTWSALDHAVFSHFVFFL